MLNNTELSHNRNQLNSDCIIVFFNFIDNPIRNYSGHPVLGNTGQHAAQLISMSTIEQSLT